MFDMSVALPVLAAILHGVGYTLYNWQTLKGVTKPNPVSLFIWLFLAALNAFTFTAMNDWIAALQMFVGTIGMTVVFSLALFTGKLRWPTAWEWPVLVLCLLSVYVWKRTDATLANMVIVGGWLYHSPPTSTGSTSIHDLIVRRRGGSSHSRGASPQSIPTFSMAGSRSPW